MTEEMVEHWNSYAPGSVSVPVAEPEPPPMKNYLECVLPFSVYEKLWCYANSIDAEIGGLGQIRLQRTTKDNEKGYRIIVEEVTITRQIVETAEVNLNDDQVHELFFELIRKGVDIQNWRLWWHSHYSFGIEHSSIDDGVLAGLTTDKELFSLIVNQRGDLGFRVDNRGRIVYVPIRVDLSTAPSMRKVQKETDRLVTLKEEIYETETADWEDDLDDCDSETTQKVYDIFHDYGCSEQDLDDDMELCFQHLPAEVQSRILDLVEEGSKKVVIKDGDEPTSSEYVFTPRQLEDEMKLISKGVAELVSLEGRNIPTWPPKETATESNTPDNKESLMSRNSGTPVSRLWGWVRSAHSRH